MKKTKEIIKLIPHLIISAILVLCAIWAADNGFRNALIAFIITSIYWLKLDDWRRHEREMEIIRQEDDKNKRDQ